MALILKKNVVCQVPEVLGVWHMYTFLKVFSRIKKKKKNEFSLGCFLPENSFIGGPRQAILSLIYNYIILGINILMFDIGKFTCGKNVVET